MAISENKMKIVINNYFKTECSVDTTIRQAFEKGFRLGVKKAESALKVDASEGEYKKGCRNCEHGKYNDHWKTHFCYCPNDCNNWDMWEPKTTGKWIWHWDKNDIDTANEAECNQCRQTSEMPVGYFCKWCGADMREK